MKKTNIFVGIVYLIFFCAQACAQNLSNLTADQISTQIIKQSLTAESIDSFQFNFGFINAFKSKLSSPPQGPYAYLDTSHYQAFLPFKNQIDSDRNQIDDIIGKIATQVGVNKERIYNSFGIYLTPEGQVNEDRSDKPVINGRLMAEQYWLRYPLNSPDTRSVNDWYDSKSPNQLFGDFYSALILGFNNFLPKIYASTSNLSAQTAKNQKAYDDRQRWLQSPEGQKYQAEQAALEKQAEAAEQARLLRDFPYFAVITCEINGSNFSAFGCFDGKVQTQLELRNGNDYNLYQAYQLNQIGQQKSSGLVINLKSSFSLKAQNSSFNSILGVKIVNRSSGEIAFQKKVGTYGVISIRN